MKQSKSGGSHKSPKQKKAQGGAEAKPAEAAPSKQAASEHGSGAKK